MPAGGLQRADRRKRPHQCAFVIVADGCLDQAPDLAGLPQRVQAAAPDQLANLVLHDSNSIHAFPQTTAAPGCGSTTALKLKEHTHVGQVTRAKLWISREIRSNLIHISNTRITSRSMHTGVMVGALSQTYLTVRYVLRDSAVDAT
ncbi:hypothetical protein D9M72_361840 [compost metagenome]